MFGKQAKYFRKAGGHVVEVGHPLLDLVEYKITRQQVYCLLACLWLFSVIQEMVLASQAMITLSLCYWCLSPSLQTSPSFTFHVLSPPLDTLPLSFFDVIEWPIVLYAIGAFQATWNWQCGLFLIVIGMLTSKGSGGCMFGDMLAFLVCAGKDIA